MRLYRIAKKAYINDLSGAGARQYGGRWNEKGVPVLYACESRSLAVLEFLAHVPLPLAPPDMFICRLELPDGVSSRTLRKSRLPAGWQSHPPGPDSMAIGSGWAQSGKTLLLRVPSVIVPEEINVLINPLHRDFSHVRKRVEAFRLDDRLIRTVGRSTSSARSHVD